MSVRLGVTIPTTYVSPIYAFDKLFLFWVELSSVDSSTVSSGNATPVTDVTAAIKFSYAFPMGPGCRRKRRPRISSSPVSSSSPLDNYVTKCLPVSSYVRFHDPRFIH